MRLQARGKLFLTKYRPGELYLSEFLLEDEMEGLLSMSTVTAITDAELEDAMIYAVGEYKRELVSKQDRILDFIFPLLDKILPKVPAKSSDM
jgi:hypothetical protein